MLKKLTLTTALAAALSAAACTHSDGSLNSGGTALLGAGVGAGTKLLPGGVVTQGRGHSYGQGQPYAVAPASAPPPPVVGYAAPAYAPPYTPPLVGYMPPPVVGYAVPAYPDGTPFRAPHYGPLFRTPWGDAGDLRQLR